MSCPAGLHFSRSRGYCVQIADSDCAPPTTVTTTLAITTKTSQDKFKCIADGFYADEKNCQKFIRCVNGLSYNFDCPNGKRIHTIFPIFSDFP
ncbi:hypothetical protein ANCDUO_07090 [Ancylostoma duodenale]|uniref:Chitin-binding type-2 domain-containing protein n=1 Tax=Ancylostoma duodenale TaxID=51022 RepID=A0A0C2GZR8_9BILA|nr:hypothetical protein ANCDUO_07090 [Ancylostoma duodenale]